MKRTSQRKSRALPAGAAIATASIAVAALLTWAAPSPAAPAPEPAPPVVDTIAAEPGERRAIVHGYGTVRARESAVLGAQVPGIVEFVDARVEVGSRVRRGQVLFRIERSEYAAAVARAQADELESELMLRSERGRREIARGEWAMLAPEVQERTADAELVQHLPQLRAAEARHRAARAAAEKAARDLARTELCAPFDAIVLAEHVAPGQAVVVGEGLISLASSDAFAVEISVPAELAPLLEPEEAGRVDLRWGPAEWQRGSGLLAALVGDVSEHDRQARVLVTIPNPSVHRGLFIGSHVEADLATQVLADVVEVPAQGLREGNCVWIVGAEGRLEVRRIHTVVTQGGSAWVRGPFAGGERIVVSNLAAPLAGMRLKVADPR